MTTRKSRAARALCAALALVLAAPATALAQEKGGDEKKDEPKKDEPKKEEGLAAGREITEQMLKVCPDLRGAVGRKKEQLLALFFDLDWRSAQDEKTRNAVASLFDLSKAEDSAVVERYVSLRGPYNCQKGVRAVVAASGPKGFLWTLKKWEKAAGEAKGRLIDALQAVPGKECWRFLEKRLDDKAPVPNWRASQEAPPGYVDLRVCDWAFRTIGAKLLDVEALKMPEGAHEGQVSSMMRVEERDQRIAALKPWLAGDKDFVAYLGKQPRATDGLSDAEKKEAKELLDRLGASVE